VNGITPDRPLIIEGVSALNPQRAKLYSKKKCFVKSDAKKELAACHGTRCAESQKIWKEKLYIRVWIFIWTQIL